MVQDIKIRQAGIRIRQAKEHDISDIMEIERESFSSPWSKSIFLSEIERGNVFVAEIRGEIVGYIVISSIIEGEVHIENIAVSKKWRRKGIGKKLLEFALMNFPNAYFYLEVRPSNKPAISLYRKYGFISVGLRRKYYGDEDAIIMLRIPKHKHRKNKIAGGTG